MTPRHSALALLVALGPIFIACAFTGLQTWANVESLAATPPEAKDAEATEALNPDNLTCR
mgnify:CR=1 FL=1